MELPFGELQPLMDEIQRVASEVFSRGKFLVALGGEHSITPPLVAAAAAKYRGVHVLQIDAHADLRDSYMGTRHNHACAMRRTLDHASITQVGIRSLSTDEAAVAPQAPDEHFLRLLDAADPAWIDRVVESLGDPVYITIDVDGMDPAIMPATGTPEPGGLSWYEMLALLRATIERRDVVGCDVVELSPLPGLMAPNFLCAKLIYKILTYRFARELHHLARSQPGRHGPPIGRASCPNCIRGILRPLMPQDLYASAVRALEQGHGEEAVELLVPALKKPELSRDDIAQFRCALAEAWLLQDDLEKASPSSVRLRKDASASTPLGSPISGGCTAGSPLPAASRHAGSPFSPAR